MAGSYRLPLFQFTPCHRLINFVSNVISNSTLLHGLSFFLHCYTCHDCDKNCDTKVVILYNHRKSKFYYYYPKKIQKQAIVLEELIIIVTLDAQ